MLNNFLYLFVIFSFGNCAIVNLPNGTINGKTGTSAGKKTYDIFYRIPYAAPPVGPLRFQPPQPAPKWSGTRDATTLGVECFQVKTDSSTETEDCLVLNVFTPQLPNGNNNTKLPVLVYIHGGAFWGGSSSADPGFLMDYGIVVVSINYRLGPFGFLSTMDEVIPGNAGLKDQQLALLWIKQNIALFGGDPDRIVLWGQSAGAASVNYQLISPKNEGLFHGIIAESGSLLSPWSFQRQSREFAFRTAGYLNPSFQNETNSTALLNFLLGVNARDLDAASNTFKLDMDQIIYSQSQQGYLYTPVIEVNHTDAFFTEKHYSLLKRGDFIKVPTLIGINSEELISIIKDKAGLRKQFGFYDENLDQLVPYDMGVTDLNLKKEIGAKIRKIYTSGNFTEDYAACIRYSSDTGFTRAPIRQAQVQSQFAPVYFYEFSYSGPMGEGSGEIDGAEKVGHGEEVHYLMRYTSNADIASFSESDQKTHYRLLELWTNFVKYLNPTPSPSSLLENITWAPVNSQESNDVAYLNINATLQLANNPKESFKGWKELYDSLGTDDFDTY